MLAATGPAGVAWEWLPILNRLQFPWRVTGPMTLAAAALVALALPAKRGWLPVVLALACALPYTVHGTIGRDQLEPKTAQNTPSSPRFPDPQALVEIAARTPHPNLENPLIREVWYIPRSVQPAAGLELSGIRSPLIDPIRDRPAAFRGTDGHVESTSGGGLDRRARVVAPSGGRLVWHSWFFIGMEGEIDGRPASMEPEPGTGIASMIVPSGTHDVRWLWRTRGAFFLSRLVSAASLLFAVGLLLFPGKTGENHPR